MQISPALVEDIPELLVLIQSAYRGEGSKRGWTTEADLLDGTRTSAELLTKQINDPGTVILKYVDDDGKMIGCVSLEKKMRGNNMKAYLGLLTVSPELQGKGVGKKLIAASEVWARENGCQALMMTVISARTELIEWYKRCGFIDTGEKEPFHTLPEFGIPKQQLEFIIMDKVV